MISVFENWTGRTSYIHPMYPTAAFPSFGGLHLCWTTISNVLSQHDHELGIKALVEHLECCILSENGPAPAQPIHVIIHSELTLKCVASLDFKSMRNADLSFIIRTPCGQNLGSIMFSIINTGFSRFRARELPAMDCTGNLLCT